VNAESREQVMDGLKKDIYATTGVWDLEKVSPCCLVILQVAYPGLLDADKGPGSDVAVQDRV